MRKYAMDLQFPYFKNSHWILSLRNVPIFKIISETSRLSNRQSSCFIPIRSFLRNMEEKKLEKKEVEFPFPRFT